MGDYGLIEEGDHIMVAVSGGKDSLALLDILRLLQRRSPITFSLTAVTIDQGKERGLHLDWLEEHFRHCGQPYHIERAPIDEIVQEKLQGDAIRCSLCSRIRRGVLYTLAPRLGCSKIALGHHLDDLIETLLLNLFFSGQLRTMPARLESDDGRNVVIRPLCYVPESWLRSYSQDRGHQLVTCDDGVCGGPDSRRQQMKTLVEQLAMRYPQVRDQMRRAMKNVKTEYLLDCRLLRAVDLESSRVLHSNPAKEG